MNFILLSFVAKLQLIAAVSSWKCFQFLWYQHCLKFFTVRQNVWLT